MSDKKKIPHDGSFDQEFEWFLDASSSRLFDLYRKLPAAEPDARLDAAVHALAQRAAVQPRTHARARTRWLPVSAAAAVVLIAAGIALRIAPQMQQRPAALPQSPAVDGAPTATMQAAPATSSQPESAPAANSPAAAATPAPPPAAPAPELHRLDAAPKPAPRAFPAPAMRKAAPASAAAEAKQETPVPPVAAESKSARQADAQPAAAAPARALAAPAAQDGNVSLYPEHWLANIRQMLRDGRRDEAVRSLAEFRKRYPDYNLPDDLRDLR